MKNKFGGNIMNELAALRARTQNYLQTAAMKIKKEKTQKMYDKKETLI